MYVVMLVHRKLRKGFSSAFALRPDARRIVRDLEGAEAVHLLILAVVETALFWKMALHNTDKDRFHFFFVGLLVWNVPLFAYVITALRFTARAISQLPTNDQSNAVRKKLYVYQKQCQQLCFTVTFASVSVAVLLEYAPQYQAVNMAFIVVLGIAGPIAFANVVRIMGSRQKQPGSKLKPARIQVMPTDTVNCNTLTEWECAGQETATPNAQLPAAVRDAGVAGVSFALLKKFAEEYRIPDDWSMANVCEQAIKPRTKYRQKQRQTTEEDWNLRRTSERTARKASAAKTATATATATTTTTEIHCSYAALIGDAVDSDSQPFVAKPTVFFSYAWTYQWKVVFAAIESIEETRTGSATDYYFIDQFCLDQHQMTAKDVYSPEEMQGQIVTKLRRSIEVNM
jgi:hypothetical protein